jgi:hypothetical protein
MFACLAQSFAAASMLTGLAVSIPPSAAYVLALRLLISELDHLGFWFLRGRRFRFLTLLISIRHLRFRNINQSAGQKNGLFEISSDQITLRLLSIRRLAIFLPMSQFQHPLFFWSLNYLVPL